MVAALVFSAIVRDGKLRVPDTPGLGITLVEEVLRDNLWEGEVYWN